MTEPTETTRVRDWVALAILVAMTSGNLLILLSVVPSYQSLFQDKLPGKPLPEATLFVLQTHTMMAFFDAVLLVFFAIWLLSRDKDGPLGVYGAMVWNVLQAGYVAFVLHLPLVSLLVSL